MPLHAGQCLGFQRADGEIAGLRNTPWRHGGATNEMGAVTRFLQWHADVFIQGEYVQVGQWQIPFADPPVEIERGVAGGEHDIADAR